MFPCPPESGKLQAPGRSAWHRKEPVVTNQTRIYIPRRQKWQQEQEDNLVYVALTRAEQELVYVSAPPTSGEKK